MDRLSPNYRKNRFRIPTKYRRDKNDKEYILDKELISRNIGERQLRHQTDANYGR